MLTTKEISENYKKLDDWKIEELANNAKTLRKDIIPILNQEIIRRNLDVELLKWVELETNEFKGLERQNLINQIRKSRCPRCLKRSQLNGYLITTIISYFIACNDKTEILIICKQCAKQMKVKAWITTLIFGWWSKRGIFYTPFNLLSSITRMLWHESEDKKVISFFIDNNTGKIRMSLKNDSLEKYIETFNSLEKSIE